MASMSAGSRSEPLLVSLTGFSGNGGFRPGYCSSGGSTLEDFQNTFSYSCCDRKIRSPCVVQHWVLLGLAVGILWTTGGNFSSLTSIFCLLLLIFFRMLKNSYICWWPEAFLAVEYITEYSQLNLGGLGFLTWPSPSLFLWEHSHLTPLLTEELGMKE